MCVLLPAVTATRITACELTSLYGFKINENKKTQPRRMVHVLFYSRAPFRRVRRASLAAVRSARVRSGIFRKRRRLPIGRRIGPMRGRVTHPVACVRACVCARGTVERLRAVCETKTRAPRMGLEGGADLSQPHDSRWCGLYNSVLRWRDRITMGGSPVSYTSGIEETSDHARWEKMRDSTS